MPRSAAVLTAAAVLVAAAAVVAYSPRLEGAAGAAVVHGSGFEATVLGWTSWYGSYRVEGIGSGATGPNGTGTVWCVDHGLMAPDVTHGYVPASLDDHAPETRRAMAWLLGRWPVAAGDRVGAAATMLVLHDLMGAHYPAGVLDVDRLDGDLVGFGADGPAVLAAARSRKADAVAHSHLQPPLSLTASVVVEDGLVVGRVTDAAGAPVAGAEVQLVSSPASRAITGSDGSWTAPLPRTPPPERTFALVADVPDLALHAYAPTRARAQRVALGAVAHLSAAAAWPVHVLAITKTGDDTAYLPADGARFAVHGAGIPDEVVPAGTPIELPAGRYTVTEVTPPAGYATAGPWEVDLTTGDAALAVEDHALRGALTLAKHDAASGADVPGAVLSISYDADHDGTFETALPDVTSGTSPVVLPDLPPGDYQVAERTPPPGYAPAAGAAPASVPAAGRAAVVISDDRLPPPPVPTSTTSTTAPATPGPPATVLAAVTPAAPATTTTVASAPPVAAAPPAPELPATGAAGTRPMVLGGLALIGLGAAAVVASRRLP